MKLFKSHVTLTLISDDLESHIVVNVSSTLTNITTIWFVAALSMIVDIRMYVWIFLPGLLDHLSEDDLKMTIFKFYLLCHFSTSQKIPMVSDTGPKYLKSLWPDF